MRSVTGSILAFMLIGLLLLSCRKDEDPGPGGSDSDVLPDSLMLRLESAKDTLIRAEDVLLENGQNILSFLQENDPGFLEGIPYKKSEKKQSLTPRLQKYTFIARMLIAGEFLVDRSRHAHPAEGGDAPAQNGLAYSYGSRKYDVRQAPPFGDAGCKNVRIYGLDCSGMIWTMTNMALLTVQPADNFTVSIVRDANKWTNAFKASEDYKDLKMEDKGQLGEDQLKNGDIIFWNDHMGIYLYGFLYQSNGTSHSPDCVNNLGTGRGPRLISFADILRWRLGNYKVFRVSSGNDYTLNAKLDLSGFPAFPCKLGNYVEEAVINITIKEDKVTVNYINNYKPPVTFEDFGCTCKDLAFLNNGSMIEFTAFHGEILSSKKLWYDIEYSFSSPAIKYQCGNSGTVIGEGYIGTGIHVEDSLALPDAYTDTLDYPLLIYSGGTLSVYRED